jgi:hypothetical protein
MPKRKNGETRDAEVLAPPDPVLAVSLDLALLNRSTQVTVFRRHG